MLDPRTRRELSAQGHHLKAQITVPAGQPSEAIVDHVRQALRRHPLVKVRIPAVDRNTCQATAAALAEQVPCELVQRVGRVALLYCPDAGGHPED